MWITEVGEGLEALASGWIARNQVRLRPVRNEDRAGESPGVGCVLEDLDLRAGVGEEVGHDGGDALFVGSAESGVEEIRESDNASIVRESAREDRIGFVADLEPSLEEPGLGGCGFALAEERGRFAVFPKTPPLLVGQVVFRYVKNRRHGCGHAK